MKFVSLFFVGPLLFIPINEILRYICGGIDVTDRTGRVVCYYYGNFKYLNGNLIPEDIDPSLCTHLIYLKAEISNVNDEILPKNEMAALLDNGGNGFYNRTAKLKEINPQLKILLNVLLNRCCEQMPTTRARRSSFIRSAVDILQTHGSDGLELDLLLPSKEDKKHFILLLSELRSEFDKYGFLIAAYFSEFDFPVNEKLDLDVIKRCCDFIIVRTSEDMDPEYNHTKLYSPLAKVKSTVDKYLAASVPPEKMLIIIPAFGVISQLEDANQTKIGASSIPFGKEKLDDPIPFINYRQLLERFTNQSENWKIYRDEISHAPYAVNENGQWITYDDRVSVGAKARYVVENKLGGAAILTLDMDDFTGVGGEGKFPLTRILSNIILKGEEDHS